MSIPPEELLGRHFVAIATCDYDHAGLRQLPGVADEVATLRNWLCDEGLGDRHFAEQHPHLADNPTKGEITDALQDPEPFRRWSRTDAAVLYVSGHGVEAHESHFVVLRRSDPHRLSATAIKTADIIAWLADTEIEHLLVVMDMCHAGRAAPDAIRIAGRFPPGWIVLASAADEPARTGALTRAVTEFLNVLNSPEGKKYDHGPYINVGEFLGYIQERLGPRQRLTALHSTLPGLHQFSPCLPNPLYRAEDKPSVGAARSDLALPPADLAAHWDPRSRGVINPADLGWLFTGRVDLMHRLIGAAAGEPAALLVTGRAGSGKSAALARLVTLTDREYVDRYAEQVAKIKDDLKPPVGAVDVAVLATGKTAAEIMTQICRSLGALPQDGPSLDLGAAVRGWRIWITSRSEPVTIVVDALDEASNPGEVLQKVLPELRSDGPARQWVRLLVGIRSPGGTRQQGMPTAAVAKQRSLADQAEEILAPADRVRVDEIPWWSHADIADYVASVLVAPADSPYRDGDSAAVGTIAEVLAVAAGTSYLIARIAADALAQRPVAVDPNNPGWRMAISEGVFGVLRDDLHHTLPDPDDRERAVHLLRAVAFAFGRGLPWRTIWPLVANAVADDPARYPDGGAPSYGDSDIAWLLGNRIGAYLVTDQEDGITVYRLFHDDLRSILRERWSDLLEERTA